MAEDFRAVIRVELNSGDLSRIQNQIKNLQVKPIEIKINASQATSSLTTTQTQIQRIGETVNRQLSQSINQETQSIRTYANNATNTINHMRETLAKMKFSSSSIDTVTADLERMNLVIENVTTRINGRRLNMSIKGIDEIGRAVTIVKEFDYQSGEILNVGKTISQSFNNSKKSANEFKTEINSVFNELKSKQNDIQRVQLKLVPLDIEKDIQKIKELRVQSATLTKEYNDLYNRFSGQFSSKQTSSLSKGIEDINRQIAFATAAKQDKLTSSSQTTSNTTEIQAQIFEYQKLQEIINKISNTRLRVENLKIQGGSQQQIGTLISDLQNLGREYNSLKSQMSGQLTTTQTSNLNNSINNIIQKVNELKTKTKDSIILKIDNGTLSGQISALENKFNKLKEKPTEVANRITALKTALQQIDRNASADKIISEYNQLKQQIKDTASAVTELNQQQQLSQRKTTLNSNIDAWLKRNSSASSFLVTQIRDIQSQVAQADSAKLTQLTSQFKNVTNQALVMGQTGLSVMDRLKKQFSTLGVYFSASMLIMRTTRTLRDMYNVVVKVDDALTELKKVSGASDSQLNISFENSKKNAKDYAMSLSDMINATADWSRTGYSLSESETLAKVSALYKNVGDNIDIDTANESLISTLQGFQLDTEEAESIIDKFNEVNKAASYYSNIIASFILKVDSNYIG